MGEVSRAELTPPNVILPAVTPFLEVPISLRKHMANMLYSNLPALCNCLGNVNSCADMPIIPSASCVTNSPVFACKQPKTKGMEYLVSVGSTASIKSVPPQYTMSLAWYAVQELPSVYACLNMHRGSLTCRGARWREGSAGRASQCQSSRHSNGHRSGRNDSLLDGSKCGSVWCRSPQPLQPVCCSVSICGRSKKSRENGMRRQSFFLLSGSKAYSMNYFDR